MNISQQISELAALIQLHLTQEHGPKDWLSADAETYSFFKKLALMQKVNPKPPTAAHPAPSSSSPSSGAFKQPSLPAAPAIKPTPPSHLPAEEKKPIAKPSSAAASSPEKKPSKPKEFLSLHPMAPAPALNLNDIRTIVAEKFPSQQILDHLPDDTSAKTLQKSVKIPDILVLSFDETEGSLLFLRNMTKAITDKIASAELIEAQKIENDKGWERLLKSPDLRLIIANEKALKTFPECMQFYRDATQPGLAKLGNVPLFLLLDLELYQQDLNLKKVLWKNLQDLGRTFQT
jgi:hypothetical protein